MLEIPLLKPVGVTIGYETDDGHKLDVKATGMFYNLQIRFVEDRKHVEMVFVGEVDGV